MRPEIEMPAGLPGKAVCLEPIAQWGFAADGWAEQQDGAETVHPLVLNSRTASSMATTLATGVRA